MLTAFVDYRTIGGVQAVDIMSEVSATLVFIWLAMKSRRWWPLVAAPSLILCVMVHFLEWVVPELSTYAAQSAQLGLWIIVYLALFAGVGERWLAGEPIVSDRWAWRRTS